MGRLQLSGVGGGRYTEWTVQGSVRVCSPVCWSSGARLLGPLVWILDLQLSLFTICRR